MKTMRIGEINFPKEVLEAQQAGELVIFAGAGVSMDPPSDYPSFCKLVDDIARMKISLQREVCKDKEKNLEMKEPLDKFLGRLKDDDVPVHELAKKLLSKPESKPNAYHKALVKLFKDGENLRIITTNCDNHFTTVIKKNNLEVEIYKAPALPVGSNFRGLVYLHGCAEDPADRLVLTDSDFGRAYITHGWARRFLQEVYSEYTVLFIGYRHDDAILSYLIRALSLRKKEIFAMTPKDNKMLEHWHFLKIKPIRYSLVDEPKNKHGKLREAILKWAEDFPKDTSGYVQRIKMLLQGPTPTDGSDSGDYLKNAVEDKILVQFFVRYANDLKWLRWTEERGLLKSLFDPAAKEDERIQQLADWFASIFVLKHPYKALGVFQRQGQRMSSNLWEAIARKLHYCKSKDIHVDTLALWFPFVLQNYNPGEPLHYYFEGLLGKCAEAEEWPLTLLVFEFLTRPDLFLERTDYPLENQEKPHRSSVIILRSNLWLHTEWVENIQPNIAQFAEDLVRISSHQIQTAHSLGRCHKITSNEWEALNHRRSAIEAHEQDRHPCAFDVVIDACRDCLEWLLEHNYDFAQVLIAEWIASPAPLLRRLAVHGMNKNSQVSADEKTRWVLDNKLIGPIVTRHEVFQLLKNTYPDASDALREKILDKAEASTEEKIRARPYVEPDDFWNGLFNFLKWLDDASEGKCALVRERLKPIEEKYPKWEPSEHPDFLGWVGGKWEGHKSPKNSEELREKTIPDAVAFLLSFKEDSYFHPNREGLLLVMAEAVKQDTVWGLRLTKELVISEQKPYDLWDRLLWSWSQARITEEQWEALLSLIDSNDMLLDYARPVADILLKGIKQEDHPIPSQLLPLAEQIASKLWAVAARKDNDSTEDSTDWFFSAINHTGGVLAEFFLIALSLRKKHEEPRCDGIPEELRKHLIMIIEDESIMGDIGCVILASEFNFLYSIDQSWTEDNVIPLLDIEKKGKRAVRAWHGFLFGVEWPNNLLDCLLPLYEQGFGKLDEELEYVRHSFTEHIARICLLGSREEVRGKWLLKFLTKASNATRKCFARCIWYELVKMDDDRKMTIWEDWLSGYWENRIVGKPVPLDEDELGEMVQWAPHLKPVFPEVVNRICESKGKFPINATLFRSLLKENCVSKFPAEVSRLIRHTASYSPSQWGMFHGVDKIVMHLIPNKETHADLKVILEKLAEKGAPWAGELL